MARFKFHLIGGSVPVCVKADALNLEELGEEFGRRRFITGLLCREGDQDIDPPVDVLVPLHRVVLVAHEPDFADGISPVREVSRGR